MEQVKKLNDDARLLRRQGRFQEALIEQQKAVDLDPTNAESLFYLAGIYGELKSFDKERDYLKEAVKYDKENALIYDQICVVENELGNSAEAVSAGESAVRLEEDNATYWGNLAVARELAKDFDGAELAYKKSLEIEPNNFLTSYNFAIFMKERGKYNQSLAIFYKILEKQSPLSASDEEKIRNVVTEIRKAQETEKLISVKK